MRIDGRWYRCADAAVRPVVRVAIISADRSPVQRHFLVDTGADRTVVTRDLLDELGLPTVESAVPLAGVGGGFATVEVIAELRLRRLGGGEALIQTQVAAALDPDALDMSVLGLDILGLFALIVDRPGNIVCLINQNHRYAINAV
jgi:predicted aspartyl protease